MSLRPPENLTLIEKIIPLVGATLILVLFALSITGLVGVVLYLLNNDYQEECYEHHFIEMNPPYLLLKGHFYQLSTLNETSNFTVTNNLRNINVATKNNTAYTVKEIVCDKYIQVRYADQE